MNGQFYLRVLCFFCIYFIQHEVYCRQKTAKIDIESVRIKRNAILEREMPEDTSVSSGGRLLKRSVRSQEYNRHPRHLTSQRLPNKFGTALYFYGHERFLRYKISGGAGRPGLPRESFTVQLWMRPHGGQTDPVAIVGMFDTCLSSSGHKGWQIGIRTLNGDGEKQARVYFSLRTDRAKKATIITSHRNYIPDRWVHVTASYDGRRTKLYIDSGKVAVGHGQRGPLFSSASAKCKEIRLGGSDFKYGSFRGTLDELRIWNYPLKHADIVKYMFDVRSASRKTDGVILRDTFRSYAQWEAAASTLPTIVKSDIPSRPHDISLVAPPCGRTVCDNPDVIRNYIKYTHFKSHKTIRYRILNIMENNGSNAVVSKEQIRIQHEALNKAFKPYNIAWQVEFVDIKNTSLRSRTILIGCQPEKIGNNKCNLGCKQLQTGNDGGDCDDVELSCDKTKLNNGQCDFECNRKYHNWDGGDCCDPKITDTSKNCFDPFSPFRSYLSVSEFKKSLGFSSSSHLNVYFARWATESLSGVATFPWEKDVYSSLGGTLVRPDKYGKPGKTDTLVHEFGHNLGLLHVHHGLSEMDCTDPCLETKPSLELGDLCEDTKPTPENNQCRDPDGSTQKCGLPLYKGTPYNNYMGYADDSCVDHFTANQVARMHCYLDLKYHPWQRVKQPSPIPLSPRVLSATRNSVTLSWIPPLGTAYTPQDLLCRDCSDDHSLAQHADTASSPNSAHDNGPFAPKHATGPPDGDPCHIDFNRAWLPDIDGKQACSKNCFLELALKYAVVPKSISVWVAWNQNNGIKDVELLHEDGSKTSLGPILVFCDMPYTSELQVSKKVKKIRVHVKDPRDALVGIDAVKLESQPNHPKCKSCKAVKYHVQRQPPFSGPDKVFTDETMYKDSSVQVGTNYKYTVSAVLGSGVSGQSPALVYTHGESFCGDGKVNSGAGEECDDGNAVNGDGCSLNCRKEEFFHCKGEPSLCYLHDGDGVCEDFERRSSVHDCGFFTPEGFIDQWAHKALAYPKYQAARCPADVVTGPPNIPQTCRAELDTSTSWYPCGYQHTLHEDVSFWLKVWFPKPVIATSVIIHLAADGITETSSDPKNLTVFLIDTMDQLKPVSSVDAMLNCKDSPINVNVMHDLSKPFFRTKGAMVKFNSHQVAIAAIALRSSLHLDPLAVSACVKGQLYNPHTAQCMNYTCQRPECGQFVIKHGSTSCTGQQEGESCSVRCDAGYYLENHYSVVTCVGGKWQGPGVKCRPVNCKQPQIPHAKFDCPDGTVFGKRCKFECKSPAIMQGKNHTITCDADGLWSLPEAYCQVVCKGPPSVPNGQLLSRSCRQSSLNVGTKCKFKCSKGYHVEHQSVRRRVSRRECADDGKWQGPKCDKVECPSLNPIYTGLYACSNGLNAGSRCTVKCPGASGVTSVLTCQASGNWDKKITACNFPPGSCPALPDNNVMKFNCPGRNIGSKCHVFCRNPNQDVLAKATLTNGRGMKRAIEMLDAVVCTGLFAWEPKPSTLRCVERCDTFSIKDGYCDAINNRQHCGWDGGDCCASTAEGGVVQPYPPSCVAPCACKDPDARENTTKQRETNADMQRQQRSHSSNRSPAARYLQRLLQKWHMNR